MDNEQTEAAATKEAASRPTVTRLALLVGFIGAAFAAWIFITATSG